MLLLIMNLIFSLGKLIDFRQTLCSNCVNWKSSSLSFRKTAAKPRLMYFPSMGLE